MMELLGKFPKKFSLRGKKSKVHILFIRNIWIKVVCLKELTKSSNGL